jgi:hypothetical protein
VALRSGLCRWLLLLTALVAGVFAPQPSVGAHDLAMRDPRIARALALLDASPATSDLPAVLDRNQVVVRFVPMAPSMYARYSVARHVIEIDQRWIDADEVTLAAVLAHEATHTQDAVSGYLASGGATACIDSEVRAFRTSARFWLDQYGPAGKLEPLNELERQLNAIAERQVDDPDGLDDLVRHTYVQQCSH